MFIAYIYSVYFQVIILSECFMRLLSNVKTLKALRLSALQREHPEGTAWSLIACRVPMKKKQQSCSVN